jgi:hypothetical protein
LAQFSPESGCGGFGLEEAAEDAQAAVITSDERVRTRTPSFFFMATPLATEPRFFGFQGGIHRHAGLDLSRPTSSGIVQIRAVEERLTFTPLSGYPGGCLLAVSPDARGFPDG